MPDKRLVPPYAAAPGAAASAPATVSGTSVTSKSAQPAAKPSPAARGRDVDPAPRSSVSMEDVARLAGVSPATVSRALRDHPNVSKATKDRVLAAAQQLSYVVSPLASRLARGDTGAVAAVAPHLTRWFYGQIVAGLESVLRPLGLDMLLYNLPDRKSRERFFTEQPLRRRVDGVVMIAMPLTPAEHASLRNVGVPVVLLGGDRNGWAHRICIDDREAVLRAMRFLLNLGHREIGMLTTWAHPTSWPGVPDTRHATYLEALAEVGLRVDENLVVSVPHGLAGGELGMMRLLDAPRPPTAVMAESDELAFGAMLALRRSGLRVPEDMSVIGVDDHEMSEFAGLTTIRQSVFEQGVLSAQVLTRAIAAPVQRVEDVKMPISLVVRSSTAPPPES